MLQRVKVIRKPQAIFFLSRSIAHSLHPIYPSSPMVYHSKPSSELKKKDIQPRHDILEFSHLIIIAPHRVRASFSRLEKEFDKRRRCGKKKSIMLGFVTNEK